MKKTIYNIAVLAIAGFAGLVASCSNDFDFDEARRENPEYAFKESFEKAFGAIDPNQSWDFTTGPEVRGTRAVNTDFPYYTLDTEYSVITTTITNPATVGVDMLSWIKHELQEEQNNKDKGSSYIMTVPKTGFKIIPIYQGGSGNDFDVHMVIEGGNPDGSDIDIPIWYRNHLSNASNFQYKTNSGNWTNAGTQDFGEQVNIGNRLRPNYQYITSTRSKALVFGDETTNPFPDGCVGKTMYFYVIRKSGTQDNDHRTSKEDFFLSLSNCPFVPDFIDKDASGNPVNDFRIVGFELNRRSADGFCDWDLNEGIFVIQGLPDVPQEIKIENGRTTKTVVESKRYMVEDLGATTESDIDFNDLVVDVEEELKEVTIYEIVNGKETKHGIESVTGKQTVTIRALGGTKDIALFIGGQTNPIFRKSTESSNLNADYRENNIVTGNLTSLTTDYMYNTGFYKATPNYAGIIAQYEINVEYNKSTHSDTYKVKDTESGNIIDQRVTIIDSYTKKTGYWEPRQNNIKVVVADDSQFLSNFTPNDGTNQVTEGIKVIEFPERGTVPTMIAVDPEQKWNNERVSVFPNTTDGKFVQGCELNFQHLKNN